MITDMRNTDVENSNQVNILIVDDQDQKLLTYEAILTELGETMLFAKTGNQAFEILLREEVAVILLDVNMPGADGFETAALIREHPRFTKTPIIFVTAVNTTELDRMRGYGLGAVDYVSVPVIPEILRAKVSVFVELHRKRRELERVNQSLRESEQRMRAILETATDGIITMDEQGVVLSANPAAEQIFGYLEIDMIGGSVERLMSVPWRADQEKSRNGASGNHAHSAALSREVQGVRKDGSTIPVEVAVSMALPGAVYTGIIRDISQRKQLEREITEISAAEQRRIGQQLHDGVSQELTGLRMMATAIKDRIQENPNTPTMDSLLVRIIDGLRAVQEQVRKVSHGLIPIELDGADLRSALTVLAERVHEQTGIECTFRCPQRVFVKDSLTATHLYHIVQEATNNALRHGQPRRIDIQMNAQTDALVLSIEDDGKGLPQEGIRRGGVGLRLMHHRASLIGGTLCVAAAASQGTVVTCTLPDWRRNNMFS
jgi:PAS domain S-box-containing protein